MATHRLIVDTLLAIVLLAGFATIGWLVADPLLFSFGPVVPDGRLIATSPLEPVVYRVKLAAACGSIPVGTYCVALIHRIRPGRVPGPGTLALYLAVPTVAAVVGVAIRVFWLRHAIRAMAGDGAVYGIEPMVTIGSPSLAGWAAAFGLVAAAVMGAVAIARGK
jgi:hypothetical protein